MTYTLLDIVQPTWYMVDALMKSISRLASMWRSNSLSGEFALSPAKAVSEKPRSRPTRSVKGRGPTKPACWLLGYPAFAGQPAAEPSLISTSTPAASIQLHQRIDRLRRLHDVEQLFDVLTRTACATSCRRAASGSTVNFSIRVGRGMGPRMKHPCGAPYRRCRRTPIEHSMIERLQAYLDVPRFHVPASTAKEPPEPLRSLENKRPHPLHPVSWNGLILA